MKAGSTLTLDQVGDYLPTNRVVYKRLLGKLIYLAFGTRPDKAFIKEQLNRYNSDLYMGYICMAKQTL